MRVTLLVVAVKLLVMMLACSAAKARLVGYWSFDGDAADFSGYANDGTEHGSPVYVVGVSGLAIKLHGSGDYVSLPNESHFDFSKALTVAAWIKIDKFTSDYQVIVTKGEKSWRLGRDGGGDSVSLYCNDAEPSERIMASTKVDDGKWHHVVGTYDGSQMCLYADGALDTSGNNSGVIHETDDPVGIGGNPEMGEGSSWNGLIDEVIIFDHTLGGREVAELYAKGVEWFVDSQVGEFVSAIQEGRAMLKEQRFRPAIAFLEAKLTEAARWRQNNPKKGAMLDRITAELRLQLTEAKAGAGFPKSDVVRAYRDFLESGGFYSLLSYTSVLLKMCESVDRGEYVSIVERLIENNSYCLSAAISRAAGLLSKEEPKTAIRFLEGSLAGYSRWRQKHPYHDTIVEDNLPEIYFRLAGGREAIGAPKKDVADAYSGVFAPSSSEYIAERSTALTWLLENERASEYTSIIRSWTKGLEFKDPFPDVVESVCREFELNENWDKYERFLDALFAESRHPSDWAALVASCLGDRKGEAAKRYFDCLNRQSRLKFFGEGMLAEECMANNKFGQAAGLYGDILKRCGPEDDKGAFEVQLCKCLFNQGEYGAATSMLDAVVAEARTTHRTRAQQAMLMKGQTHVHLGQLDKALESYFTLMMEYPETENLAEIQFFIGYCYMLQAKFKTAREVFDCLIENHMSGPYVGQARMCVTRIQGMIEPE